MSITIAKENYDLLGNPTSVGALQFWREVDTAMKKFDRNEISLLPRNFNSDGNTHKSKIPENKGKEQRKLPTPPPRTPASCTVPPQPEANRGQGLVPGRIGASHHITDPDQEAITDATIALIIENIMIVTTEGTFININLTTIVPCTASLAASTVITSVITVKANISIFKKLLVLYIICAFNVLSM